MAPNIKFDVQLVADNSAELQQAIKVLSKQHVLVGVPDTKADREYEKGEEINNAALAYIHNNGSPSQNIPARPFLEPGILDVEPRIQHYLRQVGTQSLNSNKNGVVKALEAVGLTAQNGVRARINTGPFEALKPGTLAARLRRGRTGTKPLIDTGQLRNSITFVIGKVE